MKYFAFAALITISITSIPAFALPEGCISTHSERCSGTDEEAAAYDENFHIDTGSKGGLDWSPSSANMSSSSPSNNSGNYSTTVSTPSSNSIQQGLDQANKEHYNTSVYGKPY